MKKILILGVLTSLSILGCQSKESHKIPFKSPYSFVYDPTIASDIAAKLDKDDVSLSQLYSPSPALQELEARMNKIVLVKVYQKALAIADKNEVNLTFGFAKPAEDLTKILGGKLHKSVTVNFDETQKEAAKMNEATFSRDAIAQEDSLLGRLMDSSFEQKLQAIEGVVTRRKILQTAKEANIPMEEYIQKNILKGNFSVSDAEVADFAKNNNIVETEITDELKAQLKDTILARRRDQVTADYVAQNLMKEPIRISFNKPVLRMDLPKVGDLAPHKGDGPIEIALFSYLQCEECKTVTQALSELADNYPKYYRVSYVFNFSDSNNEERMVAEAAMCVGKQSEKFFWSFPQNLKKTENTSLEENINATVKSMGADYDGFRTCFLAREFKDSVENHLQSTKKLGFYKTPVIVMDGLVLETPNPQNLMDKALEVKAEKGLGFNLFYKLKKFFKG